MQYTPAFAKIERLVQLTIRDVHGHILNEEERDAESTYMAERAIAVEEPAYSPAYIVGISGSSGISKSTLINAILGVSSLCPTVRPTNPDLYHRQTDLYRAMTMLVR